jgi:hypothetical protein
VRIFKLGCPAVCLIVSGSLVSAMAGDKSDTPDRDKTLAKLSQLVGGIWTSENPKFVIEFRYEWAFDHKAIRGLGVIDKGGPHETEAEAILGQDPINKNVYYLDCHGADTVFKGSVKLEGEDVVFEFATLIGKPAR